MKLDKEIKEHLDRLNIPYGYSTTIYEIVSYLSINRKIYIIPKPIIGSKNGYDSFPIIGFGYDILTTHEGGNSYYLGYPVLEWFTADGFEKGDEIDLGVYIDEYCNSQSTMEMAYYAGLLKTLKKL